MRSIELFAGCGGLALGSALGGFKHQAVIDLDEHAIATLSWNKKKGIDHIRDWEILQEDLSNFSFEKYRDTVDYVIGGPPCQPFSLGGKHGGHADSRNMFPVAIRAVREIQPTAFIFENVKGLLRESFREYYDYILDQLRAPELEAKNGENWRNHHSKLRKELASKINRAMLYQVQVWSLNAVNFGVPQRRERVFIVGIQKDLGMEPIKPSNTHSEDTLLYSKWITRQYWQEHEIKVPKPPKRLTNRIARLHQASYINRLERWQTVRDAIRTLPVVKEGYVLKEDPNHYINPGARSYPGHTGSALDEPAKALKAGVHGVPGGENTLRRRNGTVRYYSPRECARLQAFPDDWEFKGAWTEQMRQLGNAVPVRLAEVVAKRLIEILKHGGALDQESSVADFANAL